MNARLLLQQELTKDHHRKIKSSACTWKQRRLKRGRPNFSSSKNDHLSHLHLAPPCGNVYATRCFSACCNKTTNLLSKQSHATLNVQTE